MKRLYYIGALALVLQSCTSLQITPTPRIEGKVKLTVESRVEGSTKSQYNPDESRIKDLNLFIFDDKGVLLASRFEDSNPGSITMELELAEDYSIRAVANYGEELSFADEAALLSWSVRWPEFQKNGFMVMTASAYATPMTGDLSVRLSLKRLASKVSFTVDDSALGSVSITSVRLCQVPVSTRPFAEANKALVAGDVMSGDSASETDLALLDNGGEVVFYTFENLQGTLLANNTDPWKKVPESISSASGLCTYIEVQGHLDGVSSIFDGDVTYRFYLGSDNCRNFDVKRNTDYGITLVMSTDLDAVSWKISSDASVVEEGHGYGYIYAGRQDSLSSLYLGECFKYGVEVDEALNAYFGGNLELARLLVCNADGTECNGLELGALSLQDGVWLCDARCSAIYDGTGEIWLYDPLRDRKVQRLNTGFRIAMPRIVFSSTLSTKPSSQQSMSVVINGVNNYTNVYLTDDHGNSLGGQWYDNSLVDLNLSVSSALSVYQDIGSAISATVTKQGSTASFYAKLKVLLQYSGSPATTGYKLCELCSLANDCLQLSLDANGETATVPLHIDYYPIKLNYSASLRQLSVINTSKLPVNLSYYDFTWFGPGTYAYDGITEDSAYSYSYTNGGSSYKAYRLDCVNYENQSFGYTAPGNITVRHGTYSLSSKLFDYYNAYVLFNRDNCSSSDAYAKTYTVFDAVLKGRTSTFPLDASHLGTTTGPTSKDGYGMHGGVAVFSEGELVCATEGIDAISGSASVARADQAIIYSAELINSSLASPAVISYSQRNCVAGPNAGSTQTLLIALDGGCESIVNISYSQLAALRTMPNGYKDSFFTKYVFYWKGPGDYSSSLSNPGNNVLSYYYAAESNARRVSGSYGSDKFTSSNYSKYSGLCARYSGKLKSDGTMVEIIPVLDFINGRVYSLSETDSASETGHSSTYQHRYHPADCHIEGTIRTTAPQGLYKCVIPKLFQDQMKYLNTGYEGFYTWLYRDLSAPTFSTELENYSAGSNCDKYTTWYYKNANPAAQSLNTGTCILISK